MVDDVIGFSGSNHGTTALSSATCAPGCPAAVWQQAYDSPFIEALNSDAETVPGISYTEIWTHTDEVVDPNGSVATASASLHTGGGIITNVPTQQICPLDVYEHLTIGTVDPVAYALAVDALTHPGPADPTRIPPSVCSQVTMPGVSPNLNSVAQILAAGRNGELRRALGTDLSCGRRGAQRPPAVRGPLHGGGHAPGLQRGPSSITRRLTRARADLFVACPGLEQTYTSPDPGPPASPGTSWSSRVVTRLRQTAVADAVMSVDRRDVDPHRVTPTAGGQWRGRSGDLVRRVRNGAQSASDAACLISNGGEHVVHGCW
jgi:hypothetical protein